MGIDREYEVRMDEIRNFPDMADIEEKPKPKALRIVLIVLGVLAACCLVCWGSSFVLAQLGASQAEVLMTTLMVGTMVQPDGEMPLLNLGTEFYSAFETPESTRTPKPTIPATVFEPTLTATQSLPDSAACVPPNERVRAMVIKILSGDTIQVVVREQTWMVKYIGVRSPSVGIVSEPFGIEASVANRLMLENQVVTLVSDAVDMDPSNQYHLRYVFVNNIFVNDEMLRRGLAAADLAPSNTSCAPQFMLSEKFAQEQLLGIWKDGAFRSSLTPSAGAAAGEHPGGTPQPSVLPICDCKGPDLQCADFPTRSDAQACFDLCKTQGFGDKFLMDTNQNGIACEGKTP